MGLFIYIVILVGSFLFLVWKEEDTESYFSLKIIGYFILGSFGLMVNQTSLPLGFVVYLIFFRPKLNGKVKREAAVLGFLAFLLTHWIMRL